MLSFLKTRATHKCISLLRVPAGSKPPAGAHRDVRGWTFRFGFVPRAQGIPLAPLPASHARPCCGFNCCGSLPVTLRSPARRTLLSSFFPTPRTPIDWFLLYIIQNSQVLLSLRFLLCCSTAHRPSFSFPTGVDYCPPISKLHVSTSR